MMNLLKNLILFFLIIFFNSCAVEDGKIKETFWVVSGVNTISYKDDYREWDNVTITSDAIAIRDIASNNLQGLIVVGKDYLYPNSLYFGYNDQHLAMKLQSIKKFYVFHLQQNKN